MHERVLGVLAGNHGQSSLLALWAQSAQLVIAADAGADRLLAAGCRPHLIVGDFDSLSDQARTCGADLRPSDDQDTTDCEKLLHYLESAGETSLTLIGVEGDQLDHVLATIQSAAASALSIRIVLTSGLAWILRSGDNIELPTVPNRRLSLLPITSCDGVSLDGVKWPLQRAKLDPVGFRSVSNLTVYDNVRASVQTGCCLLVLQVPDAEMPSW